MSTEKIIVIAFAFFYIPVFLYEFYLFIRNAERPSFNFRRFLKYNVVLLLLVSVFLLILSHTNFLNYESPIPYSEMGRITFKNFRGFEFFRKELNGSKYFAYVVTSIELEQDNDTVTVTSYFYPSRSFVYNRNTGSGELFTHELYHFKITEVFARKARKQIAESQNISIEAIKEILEKARRDENVYQSKYDYDTYHSYVFKQQKKYEREVDSLLYLTRKYEQTKYTIDENK